MAQAGTLFGYLSAFVTILVALAVSDMATSTHRLLRARRRVVWDAVPVLAAAYILLWLLSTFFGLWSLTALRRISFLALLWRLLPVFFQFLAASAVLPDEVVGDRFDLWAFYLAERRYIYGTLIIAAGIDQGGGIVDAWPTVTGAADGALLVAWMMAPVALFVVLWVARRRTVHLLGLGTLFLLGLLGFLPWAIEGLPATG